jgi:hypothetical protein
MPENHPSLEELERYCAGEMPGYEQIELDEHFAACDECLAAYRRIDTLLYAGFTAENYAAAVATEARHADPLTAALHRAAVQYEGFAGAIGEWLAGAGAVWGLAAVRLLGQSALTPSMARGIPLSRDRGPEASATPPLRVRLTQDERRAQVSVAAESQTVEIEVSERAPALAVLFQFGNPEFVQVSVFQPVSGGGAVARFPGVRRGIYSLAVAP